VLNHPFVTLKRCVVITPHQQTGKFRLNAEADSIQILKPKKEAQHRAVTCTAEILLRSVGTRRSKRERERDEEWPPLAAPARRLRSLRRGLRLQTTILRLITRTIRKSASALPGNLRSLLLRQQIRLPHLPRMFHLRSTMKILITLTHHTRSAVAAATTTQPRHQPHPTILPTIRNSSLTTPHHRLQRLLHLLLLNSNKEECRTHMTTLPQPHPP